MALVFYPNQDDTQKGELDQRIEVLREAADRYKAIALGVTTPTEGSATVGETKRHVPRDIKAAYNWDEIARVLREIRDMPEANKADKTKKSALLTKLGEIYEILRAAKMPKLEAVRLALLNEANHLRGTSTHVA